ncbi:putative Zinc finger, BED-type [Corchorus olitorius]|uniref:Zinc finger, BED-type n=1 Tax=Corchorus olitorius TaxID=93759 RepID=A0A1R3ITF0_9ROSI|nr:putative Zinc finger, BED-type [Corchorus olitorius]
MPMDSNEENENVVNVEVEKAKDRDKKVAEEGEKEDAPFTKKSRKKTSHVWQEFIEIKEADGTEKVQCIHCKIKLYRHKEGTTTQYKRHSDTCIKLGGNFRQTTLSIAPQPGSSSMSCVQAWKLQTLNIKEFLELPRKPIVGQVMR